MTNRDLLKEAIADAKAIKETAIANAKAALEESFTPHLKSILAAKINEMDNYYEEDDVMEAEKEEMDEMKKSEEVEEAKKEEVEEVGFAQATTGDFVADAERAKGYGLEEEEMEEIDLDELLAELDEAKEEEMDEAKKEEMDETVTEAKEEEGEEEEGEEEEGEEEEEEEIDLENMSEEDLKNFIEGVIEDMIAAGEIEAGHEGMEEEAEEEAEIEEDINIDEILAELKGEKEVEEDMMSGAMGVSAAGGMAELAKKFKQGLISLNDFLEKVAASQSSGFKASVAEEEMDEMKKELDEAYAAINTLRSELNEINVLNAKLLYTNKIFKAKNLTESEKVKVLTAFDKAASKKEAQLVYETLLEGLKDKKPAIKENLGRASKPAGVAPSKKPIVESNDMIARFQKLAGII
jgi:hypothetical protein